MTASTVTRTTASIAIPTITSMNTPTLMFTRMSTGMAISCTPIPTAMSTRTSTSMRMANGTRTSLCTAPDNPTITRYGEHGPTITIIRHKNRLAWAEHPAPLHGRQSFPRVGVEMLFDAVDAVRMRVRLQRHGYEVDIAMRDAALGDHALSEFPHGLRLAAKH